MTNRIHGPLKYHGGKTYLAKNLVSLMPFHTHFVEVFCGALSVLFAKNYFGISEVVNDIYGLLINFWLVLQDEELFVKFQQRCIATPFAQVQWEQAQRDLTHDDPVIAAHAFFVLNRQSRQGLNNDFATLSRNRVRRGMNEQVSSWLTAIDGRPRVHDRLKRGVILNRDALDVIQLSEFGQTTSWTVTPPMRSPFLP